MRRTTFGGILGWIATILITLVVLIFVVIPALDWAWDHRPGQDDNPVLNRGDTEEDVDCVVNGTTLQVDPDTCALVTVLTADKEDEEVSSPGIDTVTSNGTQVNPSGNDTSNSSACQPGDKIGTWSEGNNPYRIEVGGHGIQHLDFYPSQGVKSISYLVVPGIADPEGVPDLAWGYGSMWEWNPPGCEYDLLTDETAYAQARLDSGHSGLVVQWGTWEIKANVSGMSQADAQALIDQHRAAFGKSDEDRHTASTSQATTNTAAACAAATRIGDADNSTVTVPAGHTYVVAAWAPREELMVFGEGQTISGVMGALWDYACGTDAAIAAEQAQGKNPVRQ